MDCEYMDEAATTAWYTGVAPMIADAKAATFRQKKAEAAPPPAAARRRRRQKGAEAAGRWRQRPAAAAELAAEAPADAGRGRRQVADRRQRRAGRTARRPLRRRPDGPGWVIQLKGYHFHNTYPGKPELNFTNDEGKEFIENTFFKALEEGTVQLPDGPNGELVEVPIAKLGIAVSGRDDREPDHRRHVFSGGGRRRTGQPDDGPRCRRSGGAGAEARAGRAEDLEAPPLRFHDSVLLEADAAHGAASTAGAAAEGGERATRCRSAMRTGPTG